MASCKKDDESSSQNYEKYGMFVSFPLDWTVSDGTQFNAESMIIGISPANGKSDPFRENISFLKMGTVGDISLVELMDSLIEELKTEYDINPTPSNTKVNDYPAQKIEYTVTMETYTLKYAQYLIVQNGIGHIITCTAIPSAYSEYTAVYDQIIQTFKIK